MQKSVTLLFLFEEFPCRNKSTLKAIRSSVKKNLGSFICLERIATIRNLKINIKKLILKQKKEQTNKSKI